MAAIVEADAMDETAVTESNAPGKRGRKADRDFTTYSEDHESFAEFIKETAGIDISPVQVKACALLRKDWSETPEQAAKREADKEEREIKKAEAAERKAKRDAEKAQYANESKEERIARQTREKAIQRAERSAARAAELAAKAEELRKLAGLDTEGLVEVAEQEEREREERRKAREARKAAEAEGETPEVEADSETVDAPKPARRRKRPETVDA